MITNGDIRAKRHSWFLQLKQKVFLNLLMERSINLEHLHQFV